MALSGDGKRVLTGSEDKTAILWDAETAKPLLTLKGHTGQVVSVALSSDGKRALTGSYDSTALLWDTATAEPIQTFKTERYHPILSVAMSSDGKRVFTGSGSLRSEDETAILWDAQNAKPLQTLKGHTDWVESVALSGDGKRVLTGSRDNSAILWDAGSVSLQNSKGHIGQVTSVRFTPGSSLVFTASYDGTVRAWAPGRSEPLFTFLRIRDEWVAWTPEGYYSCSPNGEGLIAWKVDGGTPGSYRVVGPDQFRKAFYRPDLFPHLFRERDLTRALALADRERGGPVEFPTAIAKALPPNVAIVKPERDGEIDSERVTVEAMAFSVGDHPVARMRLLVDGRPYQGNLSTFEIPESKLGKVRWSKDVDLEPGDHTIQVIAEGVSEGRSEILHIRRKAVVETLPRLFVLAIGVSAYDKESLRKDVYYAAADARKFADTVERSSRSLYREVRVVRLIDKDATRRNILRILTQISKQATQHDAVMIFFAGHGTRDAQTNFYFLPVEADLEDLASTGLSEGDFKAQVKGLPGRVILLLDACHSGALIENRGRGGDGPTDGLYRDLTSNEYGLVMMCSSKGVGNLQRGKPSASERVLHWRWSRVWKAELGQNERGRGLSEGPRRAYLS